MLRLDPPPSGSPFPYKTACQAVIYNPTQKEDGLERIIGNLDKVKLKLDEAFFYLDEIEELIQEDDLSDEEGARVTQASERLAGELAALSGRVAELQDILQALEQQEGGGTGPTGAPGGASAAESAG